MIRSVLVNHAAEILGVSRRTIYNRIREGRLKTIRTRCGSQRVLLESLEELMRQRARRRSATAPKSTRRTSAAPAAAAVAD
jgi:excisionase family DNA binding protein